MSWLKLTGWIKFSPQAVNEKFLVAMSWINVRYLYNHFKTAGIPRSLGTENHWGHTKCFVLFTSSFSVFLFIAWLLFLRDVGFHSVCCEYHGLIKNCFGPVAGQNWDGGKTKLNIGRRVGSEKSHVAPSGDRHWKLYQVSHSYMVIHRLLEMG